MALRIGFATQFFTFWDVGEPYKHYFGGQSYDFEWRTNYTYLQNLSKKEDNAKKKAQGFGATNLDVDKNLRGRSCSFFTTGNKGTDRPEWIYPPKIHKYSDFDIRLLGLPREDEDTDTDWCKKRLAIEVKALWFLYLKKSIWNNEVQDHSFAVLCPTWVRPVVYARRQLLNIGILVRHDGQIMAASYVEKYDHRKALKTLKDSLTLGHHETAGDKVELQLREIDNFGFEGQFGYTHIITYIDENNREFKYMGSSAPKISADVLTTVVATIKHTEYKDKKETRIQRVKIVNN